MMFEQPLPSSTALATAPTSEVSGIGLKRLDLTLILFPGKRSLTRGRSSLAQPGCQHHRRRPHPLPDRMCRGSVTRLDQNPGVSTETPHRPLGIIHRPWGRWNEREPSRRFQQSSRCYIPEDRQYPHWPVSSRIGEGTFGSRPACLGRDFQFQTFIHG